jgi:hypothetical protein
MSLKHRPITGGIVLVCLMTGIGGAIAAETGTKTMPDSSIYPPPTPPPVYGHAPMYNYAVPHRHYRRGCYSPSGRCK